MNIQIHPAKSKNYNNKGSCTGHINYLDSKDNKMMDKGYDKEFYFNRKNDMIPGYEVIKGIDTNKGQLGKDDAKFFCLSINPSQKELASMGKNMKEQSQALKDYVKNEVISRYAENFKKGLNVDDIRFFAKIHYERGRGQEGNNMHCHLIISRKDNTNTIKLSPLTTHRDTKKGQVKGGFDRTEFCKNCEASFDKKFEYKRDLKETFEYCNTMKNGTVQEQEAMIKKSLAEEKTINQDKNIDQNKEQENKQDRDVNLSL